MKRQLIWFLVLLITGIYLNNSSFLAGQRDGDPLLLAHRGLAQTFPMQGITGETNTARRIYPPEHSYLENTLPSMQAAFDAGADIVEFDIHPTTDGHFAVFHDWTLDYRTNGSGVTREHMLAELQALDVGYGYTADEGKTYPFRGKGVGLMPSLDEVLAQFPERAFLIHIKSDDPQEGEQLAAYLAQLPPERLRQLAVYGGDTPVAVLQQRLPALRVMSRATLEECLLPYIALGWSGYVPRSCAGTQLHIPEQYARWLWGWPDRFLNRMDVVDARVILVAGDGGFSEGFDSADDLQRLPPGYTGGIWTNRIDRIAPLLRALSPRGN